MKFFKNTDFEFWITVVVSVLLIALNFVYMTAFNEIYDLYGKVKLLTILVFVYMWLFTDKLDKDNKLMFWLVVYIFFSNMYYYLSKGRELTDYYWLFLLIPIIGTMKINEKQMWIISITAVAAGLVLLYVGVFTDKINGWDNNTKSLPAFFSYTLFAVMFGNVKDKKLIAIFFAVSIVYFYMLLKLNSRSSILASLILDLCVFSIIPTEKLLKETKYIWFLVIPLVVAIVVVNVAKNEVFLQSVNDWSLKYFDKTLFNGRENIWSIGFEEFKLYPFLGKGRFKSWHNSAVVLLEGSGILGYVVYLKVIDILLTKSKVFLNDYMIKGLLISYLCIWLHQSAEQGLVQAKGAAIPFLILGLLTARINSLQKEIKPEEMKENSRL